MPDPINVIIDDVERINIRIPRPAPRINREQPIFDIEADDFEQALRREVAQAKPKAPKPKEEKFKIFWGGNDVDPSLYNRPKSEWCGRTYVERDKKEMEDMLDYIKRGIPVIGICRGAQLLNVANGGILVQHIEGHTQEHNIDVEYDGMKWTNVKVNSTHHQMMIPTKDAVILGRSYEPVDGVHWEETNRDFRYPHVNELIIYPKTKCLCIQPHPEWMNQESLFCGILNLIIQQQFGLPRIDFKKEEGAF